MVQEIDREKPRLEKLSAPRRKLPLGWIVAIFFLIVAVVFILLQRDGVLLWLVGAFVLYSFNFIVLFLPTTRRKKGEQGDKLKITKEAKRPLAYLLKKRKKLAIEVGVTMFLGGMFPLAYSFFVIFGIGLFFALYYVFIENLYTMSAGGMVLAQILIIIGFFGLMLWMKPQERGIFRTARTMKGLLVKARSQGGLTSLIVGSAIAIFAALVGLLSAGALLFAGKSLSLIYDTLVARNGEVLFGLVGVLLIELVIMRHFQMVASRRMAWKILKEKVETLKVDVLAPLDGMLGAAQKEGAAMDPAAVDKAKGIYYSLVIFDVFEHNFFGKAPVYVVGPRIKYLLDEEALTYLG